MRNQFLLGLLLTMAALLPLSSCVLPQPQPQSSQQAVPPKPITDPQELLRRLALTVPDATTVQPTALSLAPADLMPALAGAAPPFLATAQTPDDAQRASDCLTAAVYYEARSEPLDGQRAVAQVVLNRVRDRAFPHSVCGVVYQGSTRSTGCQFSFTCDGSMAGRREPAAWERARAVAAAALSGSVYAPVGSATFYHTQAILPWWAPSLSRVATVGAHIFYRFQTSLEHALAFRADYSGWEPDVTAAASGLPEGYQLSQEIGVTVHRGGVSTAVMPVDGSVSAGVRIHVSGGTAAPAPAAAAMPVAAAVTNTSGVTVHTGVSPT